VVYSAAVASLVQCARSKPTALDGVLAAALGKADAVFAAGRSAARFQHRPTRLEESDFESQERNVLQDMKWGAGRRFVHQLDPYVRGVRRQSVRPSHRGADGCSTNLPRHPRRRILFDLRGVPLQLGNFRGAACDSCVSGAQRHGGGRYESWERTISPKGVGMPLCWRWGLSVQLQAAWPMPS